MFVLMIVLLSLGCVNCADILGIVCLPLVSHHLPYKPLWRELSLRGHNVTTITSYPISDPSLVNLTEINVYSDVNDPQQRMELIGLMINNSWFEVKGMEVLHDGLHIVQTGILRNRQVQDLLHSNFDLVIVELHFPAVLGLVKKFGCPWIGVNGLDAPSVYHEIMGNPVHPVLNPDHNLVLDTMEMRFFDRVFSFIANYVQSYLFYEKVLDDAEAISQRYLNVGDIREVHYNPSMIFTNTHPLTHQMRPMMPNTIQIGTGLHLTPPKLLPNDIQKFLDDAGEGVIYFSLGSTASDKITSLENLYKVVLEVFSRARFKVLMRMESRPQKLPASVKTGGWLPQQDILRHPNVKLFITQAGLQSIQEALHNGLPVLAIPLFGDQTYNANKAVQLEYGLKLNWRTITNKSFEAAIEELMNNRKYRERARELMEIFRDEEVPALKRAVYWTEHVLKHKGASYVKNPALNMPFWKIYLYDVIAFIFILLVVLLTAVYWVAKLSVKLFPLIIYKRKKTHDD